MEINEMPFGTHRKQKRHPNIEMSIGIKSHDVMQITFSLVF
jgi:hypothetical protein